MAGVGNWESHDGEEIVSEGEWGKGKGVMASHVNTQLDDRIWWTATATGIQLCISYAFGP